MRPTLALGVLVLAACAAQEPIDEVPEWPEPIVPQANNGAIYQAGYDVALFENATARRVGDIVTIRLVEATNASKSSSTTTSKSTSIDLPGPTIAGRPVTVHGTEILNNSVDNQTTFDGSGDSKQSNRLTGEITAVVVKRLANGNLLVRGQKWIGINQGREFIRIQGVIRPIDILPDNSIASTKVANASISYGGKGALADANTQSWLARFFNSPWMPF
ncbi:MAG: flagellar basal body L-ring protein FlgH [Steroidobacteraceae bacterium]|nr:flagellar basal body L-ring protein FlgH [Steroidobacteraceae bacterium]